MQIGKFNKWYDINKAEKQHDAIAPLHYSWQR